MPKLLVRLLKPADHQPLEAYLRLYRRCFVPDERVNTRILRWVIQPSPARVNPVHLFAAYERLKLVGGACTVAFPGFQVAFGSYIFVDPALRRRGYGERILREALRLERRGPHGRNWRVYGEVTATSGDPWHRLLERVGFRFFRPVWPLGSYQNPRKVIPGRLCCFDYQKSAPPRFSQPAFLAYVHTLFYGPEAMHRHLLPRLGEFVRINP